VQSKISFLPFSLLSRVEAKVRRTTNMARKPPSIPIQKQLSPNEMSTAIKKIERRLTDLKSFNVEQIQQADDPNLVALEHEIDQLLLDIYGAESAQYDRYGDIKDLYRPASLSLIQSPNVREIREEVMKGIAKAIAVLESIKKGFNEELGDAGDDVASRVIKAYRGLDLHPVVAEVANNRYLDGYYADAIENTVKALNNYVRLKSGISDQDGVSLMQHVFSEKNPILKFNDLLDENDRNEQKGFMQWFCGAVTGLRNPRAHKIIQDDPETSLEYIAFISLLAKLVDKTTK
jgi:uncharacterized protein (TIGR02391 family)